MCLVKHTGALLQWVAVNSEMRTGDCWVLNPTRAPTARPPKPRKQQEGAEKMSSAHKMAVAPLNSLQLWLHRK